MESLGKESEKYHHNDLYRKAYTFFVNQRYIGCELRRL